MSENDLEKKVLGVLLQIAEHTKTLNPDTIEYPVAVEELSDCTYLLEHGCDNESVSKIAESTTSHELYDVLVGRQSSGDSQQEATKEDSTMKIEYTIHGITLGVSDLVAINDYYEAACTAEYLLENYRQVKTVDQAMDLGYEVRRLMNKYDYAEQDAILKALGKMDDADIQIVDTETLTKVIDTREPHGLFLAQEGDSWVAVDNDTGDAWTEEFKTKDDAIAWLREED